MTTSGAASDEIFSQNDDSSVLVYIDITQISNAEIWCLRNSYPKQAVEHSHCRWFGFKTCISTYISLISVRRN